MNDDIQTLTSRAVASDRQALDDLYRTFGPELRYLAKHLLGGSGGLRTEVGSEDLVQTTFRRLFKDNEFRLQLPTLTTGQLRSWLQKTLKHRFVEVARRRTVFRQVFDVLAGRLGEDADGRGLDMDRLTPEEAEARLAHRARPFFDEVGWKACCIYYASSEQIDWETVAEMVGWTKTPHALETKVRRSIEDARSHGDR